MTWRLVPAMFVLCLSLVGLSVAQTPRVVSPEVLPDRRVIVRFYAPQAREVRIVFERGGNSLSKRESGVWEATIGPLDPGSEDPFIANTKATVEMLKRHGFSVTFEETTGGHNWVNWRNYLHEFAPQLFRQ